MDSGGADANICNGIKPLAAIDANGDGFDKEVEEEEEEEEEKHDETESLLASSANGGLAGKWQKSLRRKVQWNDRNGNRLVEVMEFEPSDSSDSDDKYEDNNISFLEQVLARFRTWCCLDTQLIQTYHWAKDSMNRRKIK